MTASRPLQLATSVLAVLAAAGTNAASHGQKPIGDSAGTTTGSKDPFTDELTSYVNGLLKEWKTPGMSIAVVDGDDVYAKVGLTY